MISTNLFGENIPMFRDLAYYQNLAPLLTSTDSSALRFETGTHVADNTAVKSEIPTDIFSDSFLRARHFNFLGVNEAKKGDSVVFSVALTPTDFGEYNILVTDKKGSYFETPVSSAIVVEDKAKASTKLLEYLSNKFPNLKVHQVHQKDFLNQLHAIEQNHRQDNKRQFKIAVIYGKKGQVSTKEMFSNQEGSDSFNQFLNGIGTKTTFDGKEKYRGDMASDAETYTTSWNDCEIVYHVSVNLNSEGHRRLIGNDIITIFVLDEGCCFDPTTVDELGTVPQIFAVVQKHENAGETLYRIAILSRVTVKEFGPSIPENHLFTAQGVKDFLLTKLTNGYIQAFKSPPMNRLFYVPRSQKLEDLVDSFPSLSIKETRQAEKLSVLRRKNLRNSTGTIRLTESTVSIKIQQGRNLPAKDSNGYSDPYCTIKLKEQVCKTETQKKTLNPVWDQQFPISLLEYDMVNDDLEIECLDYDRFSAADFLGRVVIPLSSVDTYKNKGAFWFPLTGPGTHTKGDLLIEIADWTGPRPKIK